ncbi:MAG: hypothetical protein L0221_07895, partial [Chloroflexi bacterium]|nr:hypothetical protein [Chloroflexota bacterium]
MSAVWMRLRAELRARWRSWVGLALLAGLAGGLATAAAAGARRTHSAYPRMLEQARPHDVVVYNFPDPDIALIPPDVVEAQPEVAEAARG